MNYDPKNYSYSVQPSNTGTGVDVLLTRLETGEVKTFYLASQSAESAGLHSHMLSLTDDLLIDFFVKGKEARKLEKERQKKAENERLRQS